MLREYARARDNTPTTGVSPLVYARQAWVATAALIAGCERVRIGVVTGARLVYRDRDERPLTEVLPASPAAVRVYGPDGCCSTISLDLDSSRGDVEGDTHFLVRHLEACGARVIVDRSPSGGTHIYLPMTERVPYGRARALVDALAGLYPTVDPGPHRSIRTGCIRPPGARHRSGGWQTLVTPLHEAHEILRHRNPAEVLTRLEATLPAPAPAQGDTDTEMVADVTVPRGVLSPRMRQIAEHGDTAGYTSPSEARQAVITGAVRTGWALADVAVRIEDGRWPGLAALYARYAPTQRRRALTRDWHKAEKFIKTTTSAGQNPVRKSHTSEPRSQRASLPAPGTHTEHQYIRTWRAALRTTEQHRLPGRSGYVPRFLLRALGEAAHKAGSREVAFGVRALAVATGVEYSTVAAALRMLAGAPDGWIRKVASARGEVADLYELTIPTSLADRAATWRWDKGPVHALRPVFRTLGHTAALTFEVIEAGRAVTISDLVAATGLARSTVHADVNALMAFSLVTRQGHVLLAHPEALSRTAEMLGVLDVVRAQVTRYARDRAVWRAYLNRHDSAAREPLIDEEEWWWFPPDPDDPSGVGTWGMHAVLTRAA